MNLEDWEATLATLLREPSAVAPEGLYGGDRGLRVAARLVLRLRFERLLDGDRAAGEWFRDDPQGFAAAFGRYHREVPATGWTPGEEAASWWAWRRGAPEGS